MEKYRIAVLGATGLVGREMLNQLALREFPVARLYPLASRRSAGQTVEFSGQALSVQAAEDFDFRRVDMVLGAAESDVARAFAPAITAAGAVFVDNSSAFRMDGAVPLVVPSINPEAAQGHRGILANPNCTTIIALTAVAPLRALGRIKALWAASYQAVSGAGAAGLRELQEQSHALIRGQSAAAKTFPCQIAYNLIPCIGAPTAAGYTTEEMKMQDEGRKIFGDEALKVCCTCVRVPVMRSHSVAMSVELDREVTPEQARAVLAAAPGCILMDDLSHGEYPTPLMASDQDRVLVGRLRPDLTDGRRLSLFCCGDQLRRGAATNAVEIAQLLIS